MVTNYHAQNIVQSFINSGVERAEVITTEHYASPYSAANALNKAAKRMCVGVRANVRGGKTILTKTF